MSNKQDTSLFRKDLFVQALKDSFIKLNPVLLIKNPVIFIVGMGSVLTTITVISGFFSGTFSSFNFQIAMWLWFTVLLPIFQKQLLKVVERLRPKA